MTDHEQCKRFHHDADGVYCVLERGHSGPHQAAAGWTWKCAGMLAREIAQSLVVEPKEYKPRRNHENR